MLSHVAPPRFINEQSVMVNIGTGTHYVFHGIMEAKLLSSLVAVIISCSAALLHILLQNMYVFHMYSGIYRLIIRGSADYMLACHSSPDMYSHISSPHFSLYSLTEEWEDYSSTKKCMQPVFKLAVYGPQLGQKY